MKPEAQRIAIAKACEVCTHTEKEWVDGGSESNDYELCKKCGAAETMGGSLSPFKNVPDYLNDLNAMHEAVQRFRYTDTGSTLWASNQGHLMTIIARDLSIARDCVSFMWEVQNATAAQRAEAFLRTLNLWKEDAPTP